MSLWLSVTKAKPRAASMSPTPLIDQLYEALLRWSTWILVRFWVSAKVYTTERAASARVRFSRKAKFKLNPPLSTSCDFVHTQSEGALLLISAVAIHKLELLRGKWIHYGSGMSVRRSRTHYVWSFTDSTVGCHGLINARSLATRWLIWFTSGSRLRHHPWHSSSHRPPKFLFTDICVNQPHHKR